MLKKHSQLFEGLFTASDLVVVSIAWLLSYWLRFSSGYIPIDKGVPPFVDYSRMLLFVWLIWGFVFRRFGLYRPMRAVSRLREAWQIVKANSLSVLVLLAVTYLFREKTVEFSRLVFLLFWGLSTVFTVTSRGVVRLFLRTMRRRGYNLRYVIIVGSGSLAALVAKKIRSHPEYGLELVGCLSGEALDGPSGLGTVRTPHGFSSHRPASASPVANQGLRAVRDGAVMRVYREEAESFNPELPVIGGYEDLPKLLEMGGIDQVIVALPLHDHEKLEEVISLIGDSIVDVKIIPDVHRFVKLGSEIEEFEGVPIVSLASTPLCGFNRIKKRLLDLFLGSFLLVLFSPLLLLLGLLVKLTSRGPVLFSQERVGLDGERFTIYKFRTMTPDAEVNGACFAVKGDPRVTPLGRLLRKTSLDELPQLVNVIGGTMSLVGPRPERPVFIQEFRRHVPRYMLRHKVQAGMTGWAQVHGWRGNTSIEKRIEHDLYYIEHWTLVLDLKILGLTLVNGFRNRNAY